MRRPEPQFSTLRSAPLRRLILSHPGGPHEPQPQKVQRARPQTQAVPPRRNHNGAEITQFFFGQALGDLAAREDAILPSSCWALMGPRNNRVKSKATGRCIMIYSFNLGTGRVL